MAIINQAAGGGAPSGAAGGDLGGTYPNPTVTGGTHLTAASVAIASLADPTTGKFIGSASNAASAIFPPGHEYDYVETTSSLTITATTEGTAQTWIDGNAVTYDGSTRILIEAWSNNVDCTSATAVAVLLDGSTVLGWLCELSGAASVIAHQFYGARFVTPSNGAHTYHVKWFKTAGTAVVVAGAGGAGTDLPAWYRITKA